MRFPEMLRERLTQAVHRMRPQDRELALASAPAIWGPAALLLAAAASLAFCPQNPGPPVADHATLEIFVREAREAPVLLGPYSRFGWNHPGPLVYYTLLPLYSILQRSPFALNLAAGILNAIVVLVMMLHISRGAGLATRWFASISILILFRHLTPPVLLDAWTAYAIILPFAGFLFLVVGAAAGGLRAWLGALAVGSLVVQTHVGTVLAVAPLVFFAGATALGRILVAGNRRPTRRVVAMTTFATSGLIVLLWAAPLYEAVQNDGGNLAKLWSYAHATDTQHPESGNPRWAAAARWAIIPLTLLGYDVAVSPETEHTPVAVQETPAIALAVTIQALLLAFAALHAIRRRTSVAAIRAVVALGMLPISLLYASQLRGEPFTYLFGWLCGATPLIGVVLLGGGGSPSRARPASASTVPATLLAGLACAALYGYPMFKAIAQPCTSGTWTVGDERRDMVQRLADEAAPWLRQQDDSFLLMCDDNRLWPVASGLFLEFDKRGLQPASDPAWGMLYGRRRPVFGNATSELHLSGLVQEARPGESIVAACRDATLVARPAAPIAWGEGWLPQESWARWAVRKRATLFVRATPESALTVELEAASLGPDRPQVLTVTSPRHGTLAHNEIIGREWDWHRITFRLPPTSHEGMIPVVLNMDHLYRQERDGRSFALPVRGVQVRVETTRAAAVSPATHAPIPLK